jgi:hypothetical protein
MLARSCELRSIRRPSLAAALLLLTACGGDTVTPPPDPGTVSVAVTPTSFSGPPGTSGTAGLTITRGGGFSGDVTLSATGVPDGVTITITPATLGPSATTSTVTASIGASAAAGSASIRLVATANLNNQVTGSAPFTVNVDAVASTTVVQQYCTADAPIWVAYQDGAGAWSRVTAGANNTYTFQLTTGRGGIAVVDTVGVGFDVNVVYGTSSELAAYQDVAGNRTCASKTVSGSVVSLSGGSIANITLGNAFQSRGANGAFTLANVPDGTQDLFAARVTSGTRRADRLVLRRVVTIAAGGTIPAIDFAAVDAFAAASAMVTVTGLGADSALVPTVYTGTRGNAYGFLTFFNNYRTANGAVPYDAIPGARLTAGELQLLYAVASTPSTNRFVGVYQRDPVDRTLAMPPFISTPTVTRATDAPYARPRAQIDLQPEYNRLLFLEYAQTASNRAASVTATRAYLGGASWDVSFPDLSAAGGWNSLWALRPGTPFTFQVGVVGGASVQFDAIVADGATFRSAYINSLQPVP